MFKKAKMMRFYKITVWFITGVKTYSITIGKKKAFLDNLKKRNDVVKYVIENTYKYVS